MCLGIPGRVVEWVDEGDHLARVEVTGVTRTINVALLREEGVAVGDWVLIHVGFAMALIDEDEAAEALQSLEYLDEMFEAEVEEIARSRIE